jgi:hypothetical protein
MQVLLQLKSYNEYFDILFEQKNENELDNLFSYTREHSEAENSLKKRIGTEGDFENVNFLFNKLWYLCRQITKFDTYPVKLLCELIEELMRGNGGKFFESIRGLAEFSVLVLIKGMKLSYEENLMRLSYLFTNFKIRLSVRDVLIHEEYADIANRFNESTPIIKGLFTGISTIVEKQPTRFRTEM